MESQERETPRGYVSRTPKNLPAIQDRRGEVVRLRAQGLTWDQVAERTGFANGSGALKAWRRAIAQKPDLAVTEVRTQERERLEEMDATLAKIISSPPAKTTAIGKTVTDPDTGETVRDMSVVVAALRERRQVGESYRRLTGADATPAALILSDQLVTQYARARAVQDQMDREAPVPLEALPEGYGNMPPEQQAQVQLERHRARVGAQRAVIKGELAP
jgi:hypothetical protein